MSSVQLSGQGPGETVLTDLDDKDKQILQSSRGLEIARRRESIIPVVMRNPKHSLPWAELGDAGRDSVEAYAAYRVGYHRGLDALRAQGWRGSGYVRWMHSGNQGFLRCLEGLMRLAGEIGETDEHVRCRTFLAQLDPSKWSGLLES